MKIVIISVLIMITFVMYCIVAGSAKSRTPEETAFEMNEQEQYLTKMIKKRRK